MSLYVSNGKTQLEKLALKIEFVPECFVDTTNGKISRIKIRKMIRGYTNG